MTMIKGQHEFQHVYECPVIEVVFCEILRGICAMSDIVETNSVSIGAQESGGEYDLSHASFE